MKKSSSSFAGIVSELACEDEHSPVSAQQDVGADAVRPAMVERPDPKVHGLEAAIGEAFVGDLGHEVLGHLVVVDRLPDAAANGGRQ